MRSTLTQNCFDKAMPSLPRSARPRRTAALGAALFGLTAALAVLLLADVRTASAQVCGDGVLDPGEACDDGNTIDGDCCSSTCQIEPSSVVCRPSAGACDVA